MNSGTYSEKARNMLKKHGWSEGESLGKTGNGIKSAIKVPLKMNSAGLGFKFGKDLIDNWWASAFNSAASTVKVSKDECGLKVRLDKLTSKAVAQTGYKSRFKRARIENQESSDSESNDEVNHLKEIKGITCHKAARHGIKMSGKLERIERQELEHLNSKKSKKKRKTDKKID